MLVDGRAVSVSVPAAVAIDPEGAVLVGERAERYALHHPRRTVFGVKRLLGRKVYAPEATVVKHIQPAADLRTRAFIAEIEVANKDEQLLPGMIASVQVAADVASSKMVISQDWLVTKPSGLGVFVHNDGVAEWRDVTIGPVVRNSCVVESGLKEGDELVTAGHRELAAGDALIIARKGTCCTNGRIVYDDSAVSTGGEDTSTKKPDPKK